MKTISFGRPRKCKCRRRRNFRGIEAAPDLPRILRTLAKKRPIFHSETDFQHALAWEIQAADPTASIRLELPLRDDANGRSTYLDLLVTSRRQRCAIELKYKTAAMNVKVRDELFSLRSHGAPEFGRYDFLWDVTRLKRYVASTRNSIGSFEMMKQILKAGPNQMETLRRLRTEAAAIDKDVTIRSERIRQTRDFRIRFWFREKTMEQKFAASQHSDPSHSGASGDKTS